VTAAEDVAEARVPRFPRRPICSRHRCGRSPLPYYLPLANMPIDPNRLYDIVILVPRPASLGTSPISSQTVREFAPLAIDGRAKGHVGVTSYQFCLQ
jgi:hypothetical protein